MHDMHMSQIDIENVWRGLLWGNQSGQQRCPWSENNHFYWRAVQLTASFRLFSQITRELFEN